MLHARDCSYGLTLLLVLAGCIGSRETRLPTCNIPRLTEEANSYNVHDPFPDEDAGPSMFSRPRVFMQPRTDVRKNDQQRYLRSAFGMPQQQYSSWNPAIGSGSTPFSVQPVWRTPQLSDPVAASPTWLP